MADDSRDRIQSKPRSEARDRKGGQKKDRTSVNIQFANRLATSEVIKILHHELLRARENGTEVMIPRALAHSLKFRLSWYLKVMGEIDEDALKAGYEKKQEE